MPRSKRQISSSRRESPINEKRQADESTSAKSPRRPTKRSKDDDIQTAQDPLVKQHRDQSDHSEEDDVDTDLLWQAQVCDLLQ